MIARTCNKLLSKTHKLHMQEKHCQKLSQHCHAVLQLEVVFFVLNFILPFFFLAFLLNFINCPNFLSCLSSLPHCCWCTYNKRKKIQRKRDGKEESQDRVHSVQMNVMSRTYYVLYVGTDSEMGGGGEKDRKMVS